MVRIGIAEGREGDTDLEIPSRARDLAGAVPEAIGRAVLPGSIVGQRVVLQAARVGEKHLGALAVVSAVDDDAAVVERPRDRVMVAERRADALGIGIREDKPGVKIFFVVRQIASVLHLWLDVVADARLEPGAHGIRALPARIVEIAIDGDGAGRPADRDGRSWSGNGGLRPAWGAQNEENGDFGPWKSAAPPTRSHG